MYITGFNVGVTVNLGDVERAIEFLNGDEIQEAAAVDMGVAEICETAEDKNLTKEVMAEAERILKENERIAAEAERREREHQDEIRGIQIENERLTREKAEAEKKQAEYQKAEDRRLEEAREAERRKVEAEKQRAAVRAEEERKVEEARIIAEERHRAELEARRKAEYSKNESKDKDDLDITIEKATKAYSSRAKYVEQPQNTVEYTDYSVLDIDELYKEVRGYMMRSGVKKNVINRKDLDDKFGAQNIHKLLMRSYLISIGKTVTMGR